MPKIYHSIWTELLSTPFRQGWVDAKGIKTRFVQAGNVSNPPLVMLHGPAGSLENFAANIASHAQHFNCIAFDMIGSGMTAKPDYDYETEHYVAHAVDVFEALDIEKASIIGLSLGARVASRFAIDHPEKVEKLILLSATAYFPARPIQGDIKGSRAAAAANPTWDNIREIFKGLFHDEMEIWDDLIATRLSLYSQPDMKRAMSHILALLDPEVYNRNRIPDEDWKTLRAPTLVVAAVDHRDVFLDTAIAIAKLIPHITLFEMKNCSHWPQMEDPDTFNRRSLEFLLSGCPLVGKDERERPSMEG
jgi:2-hydroxy-6-oxonona-2,4-dienedioate hydrolase